MTKASLAFLRYEAKSLTHMGEGVHKAMAVGHLSALDISNLERDHLSPKEAKIQ